MGLFALPLGDTPRKNAEEAIANLRLYLENSTDEDPEKGSYLLYFAKSCIETAENKLKEKT